MGRKSKIFLVFCGVGFISSLAMLFYGHKASETLFTFGWPLMAASIFVAVSRLFVNSDNSRLPQKGGPQ